MARLRQTVNIIGIILLLGLVLSGVLFFMLPGLIETRILPHIARQTGFPSLNCRINHLGLTKTSAGPLTLGATADPTVTIEQVILLYDPFSMRKGELKKVVLSGVSIKTLFSKGTLTLPGLKEVLGKNTRNKNTRNKTSKGKIDDASPTRPKLPTPPFTELEIERSFIIVEAPGKVYRIPFSLNLRKSTPPKPEATKLHGTLAIQPRNTPITLKFTATLGKKENIHLSLQAPEVDLLNFTDIIGFTSSLNAPFTPTISNLGISVITDLESISLNANLTTRLAGHHDPFTWITPLLKEWHLAAELDPQGNWQARLDTPSDDTNWQLQKGGLTVVGNSPAITLEAHGQGKKGEADWLAVIKKPVLSNDNSRFSCPTIKAEGHADIEPSEQGIKVALSTLLKLAKTHITNQNFNIYLPELLLQGELLQKDLADPAIDATLQFADGTFQASNPGLKVLGIDGTLPWHWPASEPTTKPKGKLNCRKIFLDKLNLGRFAASLQQQGKKVLLKGNYDSALIGGLKMITKGQCGLNPNGTMQVASTFEIPAFKPLDPVDLGDFIGSARGNIVDGTLSAYGTLLYDGCRTNVTATMDIKEALFRNEEKNLLCSGINCGLQFPDLPSLRSTPKQKLVFDHLSLGNIICPGGELFFQIEADKTLLVEKSRISWCGGNIETQALRISQDIDHYQSTLYCDRLELAELLEQLGQVEARGQGSVNGRIPIAWEEGKITFDDGFLYSTPGAGGSIKISGGETLTAGLPTSSPQFAQLDLAREALKDYQYQWTKLSLNSEAKELILNLQFDGKPNLPLPFVYKKELGGFARVTANSPGSHFQGISLDINLRLPLNRILQYKDLSTMIE